ncbi:MAG: diguanylate cyclase [Oscillospiraceae bacterium]|nr:diguanylate cyclase [Oscillospiraceae bacterium]
MIDFQIKIFLSMYDKAVETAVKETTLPNSVHAEFLPPAENRNAVPDNITAVFITDKMSQLRSAVSFRKKNLRIVYCGYTADAGKSLSKLEALWPAGESTEIVKKRFTILIKNLKNEFDAWFYQNALLTTINSLPDMLWYKRIDGIHTLVNDMFTEIVRKPKSEIHGKDHFSIWNVPRPEEGNGEFACAESEEMAISTGKTYICDEPVKTHEGMKQFITYKTPVYDMYGNVFGTVGIGHDVTNFSNMGIELSILVQNLPFPMIIFSSDWKVVRMNHSFEEISGISSKDAEKFNYPEWKQKKLIPVNNGADDHQKHTHIQECIIQRNGEKKYFIVREQEIRDFFDNTSGYFLTLQDITYQRAYERSIIETANTDMLTGMYNRRYFYHYLSQNAEKLLTLFYMDLDKFKTVNDMFGHAKGDEVLIKTSQIIRSLFTDAVSARLGGDEFAVVMENCTPELAGQRCIRMENAIHETFSAEGLDITISIGIAENSGMLRDIDQFIHESDTKMYEMKKAHHEALRI